MPTTSFNCTAPGRSGDEDQTASPEAARRFAQTFGARLIQVPGGDHSLSGPGMPQLVVREALEFYLAP